MFKNIGAVMQQAKIVKENIAKADEQLKNTYVSGTSTSQLVKVMMNCKSEVSQIEIDEVTLKDKQMLENLILEALRDAKFKANEKNAEAMKKATGGVDIPPGLMP